MSASHDEVSAMQVETDDFMLSLTSDDVSSNGVTEVITTEVTDLPADLASNPALWLGLEGSLESNDSVAAMSTVTSMVSGSERISESMVHMSDSLTMEGLSHTEEVEPMSIEAMEVDVQTTEVSQNEEISSIPMESFLDQTDLDMNIVPSTNNSKEPSLIPVTLSLPSIEPVKTQRFAVQQRKTISLPTTSHVTKVVLAPAGQQTSGQPLLFTVPSSASGLSSLIGTNANLRFVNSLGTGGNKVATVMSSSSGNLTSQSVRLMSPSKTITLQQAQQLGLISPKKGQSLVVGKVAVATVASGGTTTTVNTTLLAGKQGGAKFAGGNVTLVRSAAVKTPTKIAPAPPQSIVSTAATSSASSTSSTSTPQPTSLLIKNAAGQVTMATLVSARPNSGGVTNLGGLSPQKFVLRPAAPGSVATATVRQGTGTQPAQYIRLTTAQALAAGILPAVSGQGEGGQQHLHLAGNKIQLVRVVTPSGAAGSSVNAGNLVSTASPVVLGVSSATTVKLAVATSSLAQQQGNKGILTSANKVGAPVKSVTVAGSSALAAGAQRILLPAGPIGSLGTNLVVVPAQYVSQATSSTTSVSSANVSSSSMATSTSTVLSNSIPSSVASSNSTGNQFQQQKPGDLIKISFSPEAPSSTSAGAQTKATSVAVCDSNGLKPRKPCNCTKSQCLKLYCDCFANGEFCHGCNCVCCANNLEHEELRLRAIRSCLDRNPHAFKPKIGVGWGAEPRRHNKGCHCKRSGCLKNYCECYEAKIACSAICKCIGCKNCVDPVGSPGATPGEKRSSKMAAMLTGNLHSLDSRTVNTLSTLTVKVEERISDIPKGFAPLTSSGARPPFSFITQEVVEATCQCLLAQAEEAERLGKNSIETEGLVLEEFGRCLLQIIEYASKAKGIVGSASP